MILVETLGGSCNGTSRAGNSSQHDTLWLNDDTEARRDGNPVQRPPGEIMEAGVVRDGVWVVGERGRGKYNPRNGKES